MKILFTHKHELSTFMRADIDILRSTGITVQYTFKEIKRLRHLAEFIRQFRFLMTFKFDIYYCFFADYHSLLPVLFAWIRRKPSYVVVAGYDAFKMPDLKYGVFAGPLWRRIIVRLVYRFARHILPVSGTIEREMINNLRRDIIHKSWIVPLSFDPTIVKTVESEPVVLTVGVVRDRANYFRKGYDLYYYLASQMPGVKFLSIGNQTDIKWPELNNVVNVDYFPHEIVMKYMAMCRVYIQFSRAEGVPITFLEAMASGCYCIGTKTGMMPGLCDENSMIIDTDEFNQEIEKIKRFTSDNIKKTERNESAINKAAAYDFDTRKNRIIRLLKLK